MEKKYKFSEKEIIDLCISVLVISFVIAWIWAEQGSGIMNLIMLMPLAFVVIAPAFVLHELGHKFAAQKFGFYAEFRKWTRGLLFALLLALAFRVIFIAPGAVYFHGGRNASLEKTAKVGLAGPLVNLGLVAIFGAVAAIGSGLFVVVGSMGTFVNSWLAIFNLIPFGPLDGAKIFNWDRRVWGTVMGIAVVCFVASSYFI